MHGDLILVYECHSSVLPVPVPVHAEQNNIMQEGTILLSNIQEQPRLMYLTAFKRSF